MTHTHTRRIKKQIYIYSKSLKQYFFLSTPYTKPYQYSVYANDCTESKTILLQQQILARVLFAIDFTIHSQTVFREKRRRRMETTGRPFRREPEP